MNGVNHMQKPTPPGLLLPPPSQTQPNNMDEPIRHKPPLPPSAFTQQIMNPPPTEMNPDNKQLLDLLADFIMDSDEENAIKLLESFKDSIIKDLLHYRAGDKDGDVTTMDTDVSLLALASAYSVSTELISLLASKCPDLLMVHREYPYEGQTPIHTLVSKENFSVVEAILDQISMAERERLLNMSTVTDRIAPVNATVMLGGLPLSIAALTFNLEMVDLLIEHDAELTKQNDRGDTVFHSLVRFSALYPEKEAKAEEIMEEMHRRLKERHEPRSVWLIENNQGLTALKLAAQCTQPLLFNFIITLKGVYCDLDEHDGLFDSLLYDITDIDPVAIKHVSENISTVKLNQVDIVEDVPDLRKQSKKHGLTESPPPSAPSQEESGPSSILDIIYETENVDEAFKILDNHVVRCVIKDKWSRYQPLFIIWTVLHLLMMIWLTVYAVYKSRVIGFYEVGNVTRSFGSNGTLASGSNYVNVVKITDSGEEFVNVSAVASALWSVSLLVYEIVRLVGGGSVKKYLVTLLFYHNGFYRLQLMVFALCLLVDAIVLAFWYWAGGTANNYFLIVALLLGWWFTAFFLRPWKKFSFFTVMVQEALVGDMLRFSTIFIPQLLAFSVAMHITFMPSSREEAEELGRPMPEAFQTVGRTIMTMFKLMLGLSDIDVLYEAPKEWLAILLFVLYVLLTYSLMLNALIALMSNTCSIVSQNRDNQWKLQRMSIVLFLQESLWTFACLSTTGHPRHIRIEDLQKKQTVTKTRFVMKISSVRGGDGGSVLQTAVKNLADGEAGDIPEVPQTKASSDMFDLLAALNFQRKQKQAEPEKVKALENETLDKIDGKGSGTGIQSLSLTVHEHKQTLNSTYVNIRHTIQKMAKNPTRSPVAAPQQQQEKPQVKIDEPDGPVPLPVNKQKRPLLNNVPEIHPIPQSSPKIVLLPSPCLITTLDSEQKRSNRLSQKREKFRQRPDSAEMQKRFQKRREKLVKSRAARREASPSPQPDESQVLTSRPGSASSVGHGVFMVEESRIHMHTKLQK